MILTACVIAHGLLVDLVEPQSEGRNKKEAYDREPQERFSEERSPSAHLRLTPYPPRADLAGQGGCLPLDCPKIETVISAQLTDVPSMPQRRFWRSARRAYSLVAQGGPRVVAHVERDARRVRDLRRPRARARGTTSGGACAPYDGTLAFSGASDSHK